MGKKKQATAKTLATTADDWDNVLDFLQAITVKSPQITAEPPSLRAEKCVRVWFRRCSKTNLPTPSKTSPQVHIGLTGVLWDAATRFKTAEALPPLVTAQQKAEK